MAGPNAHSLLDVARRISDDARRLRLVPAAPPPPTAASHVEIFDLLVTDADLRAASRALFVQEHYARAVEEAYKCVNNCVKAKVGIEDDGQSLMQRAFSEKNPILRLNDLNSESKENEQAGYMMIFAGCMRGIRNPRAHEHRLRDDVSSALEMLTWANHLMGVVKRSTRTRKRKKKAP